MKTNIKQQFKLLGLAFLQTFFAAGGIGAYIPMIIEAMKAAANGEMGFEESFMMVAYFLLVSIPITLLAYIPAKFALRMKGNMRGLTTTDSPYYDKRTQRIKVKTFTDWAEFEHKINFLYFILSPFAFFLQLVAVVIAIIAPHTNRIYSEIGFKKFTNLEHPRLQWWSNFLFNFVVVPGEKKEKKEKKENKAAQSNSEDIDDILNSNDDNDDYITLTMQSGEEVDFIEIAGIAHKGNFYAILQPVELLEGMDDTDALVFKVTRNADGSDSFNIELDDDIIDAVFAEYNRLLDEQTAND